MSEQRTGNDKTTLMLRLPNQAGSLAKAIAPFEKNGVNMTWIESFPAAESRARPTPPTSSSSTSRATPTTPRSRRPLEAIRKRCERLEILGSYPRGECVEA